MSRPTVCYIDLKQLKRNFNNIKNKVSPAKMLVLLKADAYGHGIIRVADALREADYFGVAAIEEGEILRQNGFTNNILCLGPLPESSVSACVKNDIDQAVSDVQSVLNLENECLIQNKQACVHIKIETGMHRTGVRTGEPLEKLLDTIKSCKRITLKGVFTHFYASDSLDKSLSLRQESIFVKAVEQIKNSGFSDFITHCANSGGILSSIGKNYSMVRSGIITYGYYPSDEVEKTVEISPVLSLKTAIVAINDVKKGETISYNATFTAKRDMRVAVLPIGYGDGYKRALSNKADTLICGKRAKICGNICMDMTMVDVTDIPEANVGSEVVLIGSQGSECISADEIASLCGTISYEIMLSITARVPKIYI